MKTETTGDKLAAKLGALLRARNPVIVLITSEEARVEGVAAPVAASIKYGVKFWDCAQGVTDLLGKEASPGKAAKQPGAVLNAIRESKAREVWVLRDLHPFWKNPEVNRALRNLARDLPNSVPSEHRSIVIVTPSADVPPEFADHVVTVRWKLPDREEMSRVFDAFVADLADEIAPGKKHPGKSVSPEAREAAIDAAMGLSVTQANNAFSESVVTRKGAIDPKVVAEAKKQIINAGSGIEYYDPDPRGLDGVGGLDHVKEYARTRRHANSERARAFGIESPKGVLLVGVPGCGKSLTAKCVAAAWGVPLLRLDMGAAKGGIVGESERKIRGCFAIADAIGPCVVWIDEIEKALAGATGGALDSGVSSDALGALLTWMEEHRGGAFVIATANDVSKLPPEVLRKGRFDDIFFVDLPTRAERREILHVALVKAKRDDKTIDLDRVVQKTEGFAGSEVASLVPSALLLAFEDGERALTTDDLLRIAEEVVPLGRTAAEKVKALRDWARTRARRASSEEVVESTTRAGTLDVEFPDDLAPRGSN